MPLLEHLVELRRRLLVSLLLLGVGTAIMLHFSGPLLSWLTRPVGALVFTVPTEAFYTRLKVALYGGFLLTLPLLLHQAWLFMARAFDKRLRRMLLGLVCASYFLFLLGAGICFFFVVPTALRFLLSYGSGELRPLLTLSAYLEFVIGLSLAFGIVFELPLILYAANRLGMLERGTLISMRRPVYLLCFVAAAFLTPGPDLISQISLAIPAIVLFEISLLTMG
jgi:sec-independent protein translocase protein TatC